jgi:hypothetical protein
MGWLELMSFVGGCAVVSCYPYRVDYETYISCLFTYVDYDAESIDCSAELPLLVRRPHVARCIGYDRCSEATRNGAQIFLVTTGLHLRVTCAQLRLCNRKVLGQGSKDHGRIRSDSFDFAYLVARTEQCEWSTT